MVKKMCKVPTASEILAHVDVKLWGEEILQKEILDKLAKAQERSHGELTATEMKGYVLVREKTETICSNTSCNQCGLNYLLDWLEKEEKKDGPNN